MVEDDEQTKAHEIVNNSVEGDKKEGEDAAAQEAKDEDNPSVSWQADGILHFLWVYFKRGSLFDKITLFGYLLKIAKTRNYEELVYMSFELKIVHF